MMAQNCTPELYKYTLYFSQRPSCITLFFCLNFVTYYYWIERKKDNVREIGVQWGAKE